MRARSSAIVRTGSESTATTTCPGCSLPAAAGLPALTVSTLAPVSPGASVPSMPSHPATRSPERRSSATPTTSWLGRKVVSGAPAAGGS